MSTATEQIRTAFVDLDPRDRRILTERTLPLKPRTLDAIGQDFELTRERIRQLEKILLTHLRRVVDTPEVDQLVTAVRRIAHPVATEGVLRASVPEYDNPTGLGQYTVGQVIGAITGAYITDGTWVAPTTSVGRSLHVARSTTLNVVTGMVTKHGTCPLDAIAPHFPSLTRTHLTAWLAACKIGIIGDHVALNTRSVQDRAAAVLDIVGKPLTGPEIIERSGKKGSVRSLLNVLIYDDRFIRAGKSTWALTEWGLTPYSTIQDAISAAVDADPLGRVRLEELTRTLAEQFGVSEKSVAAYANSADHQVVAGYVLPRTAPLVRKRTTRMRAGTYRRPDGTLVHREVITHEHTRGSGTQVPTSFAHALDMTLGETVIVTTVEGPTPLTWNPTQITIGSTRAIVERLGLLEGDVMFVVLNPTARTLTFEVCPKRASIPAERALELTGQDVTGDLWATLAAAVDAPKPTPKQVCLALVLRGDTEILPLLPTDGLTLVSDRTPYARHASSLLLAGTSISETAKAVGVSHNTLFVQLRAGRSLPLPVS